MAAAVNRLQYVPDLERVSYRPINDAQKRPVLANYGLSPSLLTYAGAPILLQPKFESPVIRAKTGEFLNALYSREEDLHAFCRRYGARIFVYSTDDILDETPDGPRYASGRAGLRPDTAAVLFHFHPEKLRRFRLLYQNQDFRVFSVADGEVTQGIPPPPEPIYDLEQFEHGVAADGSLRLDTANVIKRLRAHRQGIFLARLLIRMGRGEDALAAYTAAFAAWPPDAQVKDEARRLRAALEGQGAR